MSGDQLDLDAVESRANAASEGPWQADAHSHIQSGCRCLSCYDNPTVYQLSTFLDCEDVPRWDDDATRCERSGFQTWADADFAAHAREDVPALVAEVRRLRALARAVIRADDDSVSYEPCAECLRSGVALLDGASYDTRDAAVEALRAALGGDDR